MLSLREHVGGYEVGPCRVVGHHQHLRGAGGHVDGGVHAHLLLGMSHVAVAGPENFVDGRDALRAVSHGSDGLRAADAVDGVHAATVGGVDDFGRNEAVGTLWRAEHHLLAAGNAGGQCQHEHGAEERGAAAGNIEAHALQRHGLLYAVHALLGVDVDRVGTLGSVKGLDVVHGAVDGSLHVVAYALLHALPFVVGEGERVDVGVVEGQGETAQGLVAMSPHLGYDVAY